MLYTNLSKKEILKIYNFALKKRENGLGQRKISKMIKENFGKEINESTISNWIYHGKAPFGNKKTQFKSLPKPKMDDLYELYINQDKSAQIIAKKYNVSTVTIIKWLRAYGIKTRNHRESMNTNLIKNKLKEKKLRRPTKSFSELSPSKAYLLGVLCGDGCISNKSIRLEIRKDEEFIQKFTNCLKEVYGLDYKFKYYAKRDSLIIYVASEIICSDLMRYCKFKTFDWYVPREILKSKNEIIIGNFLKGIFDSEGSANKYCVSMSSANKEGIKEINLLLNLLGIENKIAIRREKYYVLYITKRERLKKFREKVGFTIERKMEQLKNIK